MNSVHSIHPFDEIIAAGIDLSADVALFPTFISEHDNSVELDVLSPAPDFGEARATVNTWIDQKTRQKLRDKICVAYLISPHIVEAVIHFHGRQDVFHGEIDRSSCKVRWHSPSSPAD